MSVLWGGGTGLGFGKREFFFKIECSSHSSATRIGLNSDIIKILLELIML